MSPIADQWCPYCRGYHTPGQCAQACTPGYFNGGVTVLTGTQGEWVKEVWTSDRERPVWHDDASPIEIPWP